MTLSAVDLPQPLGPTSDLILTVLGFNLILILALTLVVFMRFAALFDARERDAGARLQVRFVLWFAFAAVVPALVVALFYGVLVSPVPSGAGPPFSDT